MRKSEIDTICQKVWAWNVNTKGLHSCDELMRIAIVETERHLKKKAAK